MTAPSPARPARRAPGSLLVAMLTAALVLGPVAAAGAATTPPPTEPVTPATVVVTLAPAAGGVAGDGRGLTAVVAVQNGTTGTIPAAAVQLLVGDTPFSTRQEAASWSVAPDDRELAAVGAVTLEPIAPGERRTWSITVSPLDPALATRPPGVYPLLARYGQGTTERSATSTLVVADPSSTATPVGVVVPITAPPRTTGLITADELAQYTAVDGPLTQQLDGVEGTGAILAVDPAIVASIRVLGDGAPTTASAWLERLMTLSQSRFALQFGDADIAAQLHSETGMLLSPEPFDAQLDPTDFPDADFPDADADFPDADGATATPTPGVVPEPALPTLDELLDVGDSARDAVYWPATGTADAAVIARLTADDASALTLIPSDTTGSGVDGATVGARGDGTLVYDSTISASLDAASRIDDQITRDAALADVAAQLAFALPALSDSALLVTLDRADGRSRVAIRAAIEAVTATDGVVLRDLDDVADATPGPVLVTGGTVDPARAAAVDALVADEAGVARFATVLDDARLLTAPARAATLQVLGDGWLADDVAWQAAYDGVRDSTTATLASVSIPPPTDVNLLTANTRLQFVVRNALPWPVTVTLVAEPDDPRLRVQRATEVNALPASDTRVVVPVESRVGSGDVGIALQLRSPAGVEIGGSDSVDVRVRAEWEGFGVVALSILVGGLLVLGVIRTVLRRRSRRDSDAPKDATA